MSGSRAALLRAGRVMPAAGIGWWLSVLLLAALAMAAPAAATAADARLRVCFLSLHEPDELDVFRSHFDAQHFVFTDLGGAAARLPAAGGTAAPAPWLLNACRPNLTCDVVIFSGEFAGRFFGR